MNVYNGESLVLAAGMATANKIVRETPVIKTILIVSNSTAAISNIT